MDKKWIKSKKAVMNPRNKDEECFNALLLRIHHEEIKHHPERIRLLSSYENQYNWSFQYRLRRLIGLKRTNLAQQ